MYVCDWFGDHAEYEVVAQGFVSKSDVVVPTYDEYRCREMERTVAVTLDPVP